MRAVLELEFIGENLWAYGRALRRGDARCAPAMERAGLRAGPTSSSRPWVARLTGLDPRRGAVREFVRGQIDYSRANGTGSRGVYLYYILTPGVYEVNARETWTRTRRYYIRVADDGTYAEVPREEVEAWLCGMRP